MGYSRRKPSEHDLYHLVVRGAGKQLVFEDDHDRRAYIERMGAVLLGLPVELYAWCLMGNHVHLLVHADLETVGTFMRDLGRSYSQYFNRRHERVGHLFQGRYRSIPVASEPQLLTVVRYIHQNPPKADLSQDCRYQWSSYCEYLCDKGLTTREVVLGCFGSLREFERFHADELQGNPAPHHTRPPFKVSDAEARLALNELLSEKGFDSFPLDAKDARDEILAALRERGLPIRQIVRITGVGKHIIERATRS